MDRDKPDTWTSVMGRDCSSRAQQRNGALGRDKSPGFGAANTSQLCNLAYLVWLAGNHGSPWLAPVAMNTEQDRMQKDPKAQANPMYCTGDGLVNAKAREAALMGKHLRNTHFQFPADPTSTFLSSPQAYILASLH